MIDIHTIYPENRMSLREVGLRDGLKMVKTLPTTQGKIDWIHLEYDAGIRHFELGTFLPKDRYLVFADIQVLIDTVATLPGAYGSGLSPNKIGSQNALSSGILEIHCVLSVSEANNKANLKRTRETTLREIFDLCALRTQMDSPLQIGVGLAMSFGCSISGSLDPAEVLELAEQCYDAGVDIVSIADTVGYAGPKQVENLAARMCKVAGNRPFGVHLHDTRGMGLANAAAAIAQGVRVLDASLGGLGGCPAAPNATGNIVMEDFAYLCQTSGFETGVNLEKLIAVRDVLRREMPNEPLYGGMAKVGLPMVEMAG
jgi:hydroxymethylglutaryl-CoA lyase